MAAGESLDATAEVARPWAAVVHGPDSTRAALVNAGARTARGDVLFFLHTDSLPPPDFLALIQAALADPLAVGGAFDHQFTEPILGLWLVSTIDRVRFHLTRNYYGDQGIFVRRAVFERMGGFPVCRPGDACDLRRCTMTHLDLSPRRSGAPAQPRAALSSSTLLPQSSKKGATKVCNKGVDNSFRFEYAL